MSDNPFGGMPFFGDLARMLQSQGPVAWDAARQLAHSIANEGGAEPNVDPLARIQLEQLARAAELHVAQVTGLETSPSGHGLTVGAVTRTQWVARTLDDHKPLFERLASSLGSGADATGTDDAAAAPAVPGDPLANLQGDPGVAWLGQLMGMLQPMMLGMSAGSMVGHLSTRSFGQYDLPVPRPAGDELMVLPSAIDAFAQEWSLALDDLRLWVLLHEIAHHAVLGVPHVRATVSGLISDFVAGFEPDPQAFERSLGDVDPGDPSGFDAVQRIFTDPEVLLGAATSPAQAALRPRLDALTSVIIGYVDRVMDTVGGTLLGSYPQVTEAMRRRRVQTSDADRFVERLFGLNLTQDRCDVGESFVEGVAERAGDEALARLWTDPDNLPTPAEIDAPGLWLARIDLPAT